MGLFLPYIGFFDIQNIALITMLLFACLPTNIDKYLSGAKWVRMEFLGMSHAENCPHGLYRSVTVSVLGVVISVGALDVHVPGILAGPEHVAPGSGYPNKSVHGDKWDDKKIPNPDPRSILPRTVNSGLDFGLRGEHKVRLMQRRRERDAHS